MKDDFDVVNTQRNGKREKKKHFIKILWEKCQNEVKCVIFEPFRLFFLCYPFKYFSKVQQSTRKRISMRG